MNGRKRPSRKRSAHKTKASTHKWPLSGALDVIRRADARRERAQWPIPGALDVIDRADLNRTMRVAARPRPMFSTYQVLPDGTTTETPDSIARKEDWWRNTQEAIIKMAQELPRQLGWYTQK
eukprot:jgi/Mesvir1/24119/Mv10836-RA.1